MLSTQDLLVVLFAMVICLVPLGLWIWALVDVLKSEFHGNNKIIWFLLVVLLPGIGFVLYFIIGRGQKRKKLKGREA